MKLDKDICLAMEELYKKLPQWHKDNFVLYPQKGGMIEKTSSLTCGLVSEEGCKRTLITGVSIVEFGGKKRLVFDKETEWIWTPVVKTNDSWGNLYGVSDDQEEVSSDRIDELDDESKMASEIKARSGHMDDYRPYMTGMQMANEDNPRPCLRKIDNEWIPCKYHTGYRLAEKVLKKYKDPETIAKLIIWFFLHPRKIVKSLPEGDWTFEDYQKANLFVLEQTRRNIDEGLSIEEATRRAFGTLYRIYPQYPEYRRWLRNVRYDKASDMEEASLLFHRWGWDVDEEEAKRAYSHFVQRDKFGFNVNRHTSKCPFVLSVPEGKWATKIVCFTAVNQRLQIPEKEVFWVRTDSVDESAIEFNQRPVEERKELLGCKCKHCIQERVFIQKGDRFVIASESLLGSGLFNAVVDGLAYMSGIGIDGISGEEMDLLRANLHVRESKQQLEDDMFLSLKTYAQTEPPVIRDKEQYDLERAAKAKETAKKTKAENKAYIKALRAERKVKAPVKQMPAQMHPKDKEIYYNQVCLKVQRIQERVEIESEEWEEEKNYSWIEYQKFSKAWNDRVMMGRVKAEVHRDHLSPEAREVISRWEVLQSRKLAVWCTPHVYKKATRGVVKWHTPQMIDEMFKFYEVR